MKNNDFENLSNMIKCICMIVDNIIYFMDKVNMYSAKNYTSKVPILKPIFFFIVFTPLGIF